LWSAECGSRARAAATDSLLLLSVTESAEDPLLLFSTSPRYAAALDVARPRGARLLTSLQLKVNRRVRLFEHASFDQWVLLEATLR